MIFAEALNWSFCFAISSHGRLSFYLAYCIFVGGVVISSSFLSLLTFIDVLSFFLSGGRKQV